MKRYIDNVQKNDLEMTAFKRKCRCGHTQLVHTRKEWSTCRWCGGRIYRDEEKQLLHNQKCELEEFRYNLQKQLRTI